MIEKNFDKILNTNSFQDKLKEQISKEYNDTDLLCVKEWLIYKYLGKRQHENKMNGGNLMDKDPFKEYIKQSEPSKSEY